MGLQLCDHPGVVAALMTAAGLFWGDGWEIDRQVAEMLGGLVLIAIGIRCWSDKTVLLIHRVSQTGSVQSPVCCC